MLMIRLQRIGRKNQAAFRLLVIDSHSGPKAGKNVELLGSYNPHNDLFQVEKERVLYWMSQGAQVSDTVRNLLISNKIIEGKKVNVLPRKAPIKGDEAVAPSGASALSETPIAAEEATSEVEASPAEGAKEEVAA